jgi:MGT family glycosyltransferase
MAKVLWFHIPARGHITPTLPVIRELERRGHQVTVCCTEETRALVERSGASFVPYPGGIVSMQEIAAATVRLVHPGPLMLERCDRLVPFAEAEIRRTGADLVVYDQLAVWAGFAARRTGTPTLASFTMLVAIGSARDLGLRAALRWKLGGRLTARAEQRALAGLAASLGAEVVRPPVPPAGADRALVVVAPELHPPVALDDRFRLVGPSLATPDQRADHVAGWSPPPGDGPLIYVSTGTVNKAPLRFYRAVIEAFRDHPARVVLYVGHDIDPAALGRVPDRVVVSAELLPQLQVLEQADVFVSHGGMNSVQEGLDHGVPMVLVPHQLEQLINAKRVEALGAGVVLGRRPPFGQVRASDLRAAVDRLLADGRFRTRASELGAAGRAAGGTTRAADEIERMLAPPS